MRFRIISVRPSRPPDFSKGDLKYIWAKCDNPLYPDISGNATQGAMMVMRSLKIRGELTPVENRAITSTLEAVATALYLSDCSLITLDTEFAKTILMPKLFIGGWRSHVVGYAVFQDFIYICNRGEGVKVTRDEKAVAVMPLQLNRPLLKELLHDLWELKYFDRRAANFRVVYNKYYAMRKTDKDPRIPGVYFYKTPQDTGNCWYFSVRMATAVVMGLHAQNLGVQFKPIYDATLQTKQMLKIEIPKLIKRIKETNDPNDIAALQMLIYVRVPALARYGNRLESKMALTDFPNNSGS